MSDFWNATNGPLSISSIRVYCRSHPYASDRQIANELVNSLSEEALRSLACSYVMEEARDWRRSETRKVEVIAAPFKNEQQVDCPCDLYGTPFTAYRDNLTLKIPRADERKRFRKWLGAGFNAWYRRSHELIASTRPKDLEYFEADWAEGGVMAYHRNKSMEELMVGVRQLVDSNAARVRLELTQELLNASFALADGTKVLWGNATIEEHANRIAFLMKHSASELDTASRHQAAINLLQHLNVSCLNMASHHQEVA